MCTCEMRVQGITQEVTLLPVKRVVLIHASFQPRPESSDPTLRLAPLGDGSRLRDCRRVHRYDQRSKSQATGSG
jgi:hypothetical protein